MNARTKRTLQIRELDEGDRRGWRAPDRVVRADRQRVRARLRRVIVSPCGKLERLRAACGGRFCERRARGGRRATCDLQSDEQHGRDAREAVNPHVGRLIAPEPRRVYGPDSASNRAARSFWLSVRDSRSSAPAGLSSIRPAASLSAGARASESRELRMSPISAATRAAPSASAHWSNTDTRTSLV